MADPRKTYVGEIGKRIKVNVGIALDSLQTATIYVEKPDGSVATEWLATRLGTASYGWVYYNTVDGDLSVPGIYRLYTKLVFADGRELFGANTFFNVYTPSKG